MPTVFQVLGILLQVSKFLPQTALFSFLPDLLPSSKSKYDL